MLVDEDMSVASVGGVLDERAARASSLAFKEDVEAVTRVHTQLPKSLPQPPAAATAVAKAGLPQPSVSPDSSPHAGSCANFEDSSGDFSEEQVEVLNDDGIGQSGLRVDEWHDCSTPSRPSGAAEASIGTSRARAHEAPGGTSASSAAPADGRSVIEGLLKSGGKLDMADPEAKKLIVDGMTDQLLDNLIDDSIQTQQRAESPLIQPTPMSRPGFLNFTGEFDQDASSVDGTSSAASNASSKDTAAASPFQRAGRAAAHAAVVKDHRPEQAPHTSTSASPTGSDAGSASSSELSSQVTGVRSKARPHSTAGASAAEAEVDGSKQGAAVGAATKDAPRRPASPPPGNVRPLATSGGATGSSAASSGGVGIRSQSKGEVADCIVEELLETLLGEVWAELGDRRPRVGAGAAETSAGTGINLEGSGSGSGLIGLDLVDSFSVSQFLDAAFSVLGVKNETDAATTPLPPVDTWLPAVMENIRQQCKDTAAEALAAQASSPSSRRTWGCGDAWGKLLADTLIEVANVSYEEVISEPRLLGWRRPGFGQPPLSKFQDRNASRLEQARTWAQLRKRAADVVTLHRAPDGSNDADGTASVDELNIDENIDALLLEEICRDEASWLDIGEDVVKVKKQIVQLIFADLVDETVEEIRDIWSGVYRQ